VVLESSSPASFGSDADGEIRVRILNGLAASEFGLSFKEKDPQEQISHLVKAQGYADQSLTVAERKFGAHALAKAFDQSIIRERLEELEDIYRRTGGVS